MVLGTSKGADDDDGRRPFDGHAPSSHLTPGPGRTNTNAGRYYHAFQQINLTRRRRQPILFSFVVMMLMNETLHASNSSKHNFRFLKTGPNAQGKTHFAWDANINAQNRARRAVSPEQAHALHDRTIGHIPSGAQRRSHHGRTHQLT